MKQSRGMSSSPGLHRAWPTPELCAIGLLVFLAAWLGSLGHSDLTRGEAWSRELPAEKRRSRPLGSPGVHPLPHTREDKMNERAHASHEGAFYFIELETAAAAGRSAEQTARAWIEAVARELDGAFESNARAFQVPIVKYRQPPAQLVPADAPRRVRVPVGPAPDVKAEVRFEIAVAGMVPDFELTVLGGSVLEILRATRPAASPAPAAAKAAAEAQLTLLARFDPPRLAAGDLQDVVLRLQLMNSGPRPVAVYPGAAVFSANLGWGSPTWHLEPVGSPPGASLVSLRSYYGPPGHPPNASYFAPHRRVLAPAARHEELIPGCFIPALALDSDSLSPRRLDPQGFDGFAAPPAGTAVLLLRRNCAWVREQMKQGAAFLRPGLFLLMPKPGPVKLEVHYRQKPWMDFRPENSVSAKTTAELEREP